VTVHAADQAVLAVALAVDHRLVALMIQQFHMVAAHDFDRFDALLGARRSFRARNRDLTETGCFILRRVENPQRRQAKCCQQQ
jgi:hypothetical protein